MATKIDRNNLGFLGIEFQYRLCKAFMEDNQFFSSIYSVVNQNMFTDPYLRTFVGVLKDYYEKYNVVPSYPIMDIELRAKGMDEIDRDAMEATLKRIQNSTSEGHDSITEKAERFFKQQNMVRVANEVLKIASSGDLERYDDCLTLMQNALNVGDDEGQGVHPLDGIEEVLSDDYRVTIPTGIGKLDEKLEGGLGKGELGVIIGPSSFGKSLTLDTLICCPTGFYAMRDIHLGNYVIGRNGKPTKVVGVFPQGERPVYKMSFSDGTSCLCDEEHLWSVNLLYENVSHEEDWEVKTLKEIMDAGLHINVNGEDKYRFKVPMPSPVSYEERLVSLSPYDMGACIGIGDSIKKEGDKVIISRDKDGYSIVLKDLLAECFLEYYPESMTKDCSFIPTDYLYNSLENRIKLLNGLMDSVGSCTEDGSCFYKTKFKKFAEDVRELVLSLGGFAFIKGDEDNGYEISFSLCDSSIPIFTLPPKQEEVKYMVGLEANRYIEDIEYVGMKECQCIKVEAEDGLFLVEDYIVTHNTSLTTAMAAYAATYKCEANAYQGFKVIQFVFEDREKQIQRKYIGRITGVEAKDLSKKEFVDSVKDTLASYQDKEMLNRNVIIMRYPSGEKSIGDLIRFVRKKINQGFSPDLVIIDYFECLKMEKGRDTNDDKWSKEGYTMRKIESTAGEYNLAVWCTTQGTKDSLNAEIVTMDKAGGAVAKIQIGHIVLSIARTMEDIERAKATLAILKNRAGGAGKVFNNVEFNNGTCRISTDDADEFDTMLDFKKSSKEELERQRNEIVNEILKRNVKR